MNSGESSHDFYRQVPETRGAFDRCRTAVLDEDASHGGPQLLKARRCGLRVRVLASSNQYIVDSLR